MSIKQAFKTILALQQRDATLVRPDVKTVTIKMAPSNFFRNLAGPSEIVIDGYEFIISKDELDRTAFGPLKRGDRLTDSIHGTLAIDTIQEMYDLGGAVLAYRVRTA